jgi:hypothetical protein
MIRQHWCWFSLTAAVLIWYSAVTVYVALKGALDIKQMLASLGRRSATGRPDQEAQKPGAEIKKSE